MLFAILYHHSLQPELLGALIRNWNTNQTAPVRGHEINGLRRHLFRRHHQIAFILAIGIIGYDDHAPLCDVA